MNEVIGNFISTTQTQDQLCNEDEGEEGGPSALRCPVARGPP